MTLPQPTSEPDPTITQILNDVDAVAGELETPRAYFDHTPISFGPLVASLYGRSIQRAHIVALRMGDHPHPNDLLALHTIACTQRGIAYGLELAKRYP